MAEGIERTEINEVTLRAEKRITLSEGHYKLGYQKDGGNWAVLKTDAGNDFDGTVPAGKEWASVIRFSAREKDE